MHDDDIDSLLRQLGERWREDQPAPAEPDFAALTAGPHRARWTAPVAAAAAVAAVAAVAAGAAVLARDDGGRQPTGGPTGSLSAGAVVPWKVIDPGHPKWPAPLYDPEPGLTEGRPWCTDADLVTSVATTAAAGTSYTRVSLRAATPTTSCRLPSHPSLAVMGHGGTMPVVHEEATSGPDGRTWPYDVPVDPAHAAVLTTGWASLWCGPAVTVDRYVVSWDAQQLTVPGFGRSPGCSGDPGDGAAAPLRDYGVSPEHWTSTPFPTVTARQVGFVAGDESDTYVLEVLAPDDVLSLAPCPDQRISQRWSEDDESWADFGLNCAAVPFRDAAGDPYLPVGTPVRFAIEVRRASGDVVPVVRWTLGLPEPVTVELHAQ